MAHTLDAATLLSISKNRNKLLKLAEGIKTRKKSSKKSISIRNDPAYSADIEHLVFGSYRPRAATPDARLLNNTPPHHADIHCDCPRHGAAARQQDLRPSAPRQYYSPFSSGSTSPESSLEEMGPQTPRATVHHIVARIPTIDTKPSPDLQRHELSSRQSSGKSNSSKSSSPLSQHSGIPRPKSSFNKKSPVLNNNANVSSKNTADRKVNASDIRNNAKNNANTTPLIKPPLPVNKNLSSATSLTRLQEPNGNISKRQEKNSRSKSSEPNNRLKFGSFYNTQHKDINNHLGTAGRYSMRTPSNPPVLNSQHKSRASFSVPRNNPNYIQKTPLDNNSDTSNRYTSSHHDLSSVYKNPKLQALQQSCKKTDSFSKPEPLLSFSKPINPRANSARLDNKPPLAKPRQTNLNQYKQNGHLSIPPLIPSARVLQNKIKPISNYNQEEMFLPPKLDKLNHNNLMYKTDEQDSKFVQVEESILKNVLLINGTSETLLAKPAVPSNKPSIPLKPLQLKRNNLSHTRKTSLPSNTSNSATKDSAPPLPRKRASSVSRSRWISDIEEKDESSSSSRASEDGRGEFLPRIPKPPSNFKKSFSHRYPRKIEKMFEMEQVESLISSEVKGQRDHQLSAYKKELDEKDAASSSSPDRSTTVASNNMVEVSTPRNSSAHATPTPTTKAAAAPSSTVKNGAVTGSFYTDSPNTAATGDSSRPPPPNSEEKPLPHHRSPEKWSVAFRLSRNKGISRSERHLKAASSPEFRINSNEDLSGSVRDVHRPWSQVYSEGEVRKILFQRSSFSAGSMPSFQRGAHSCGEQTPTPEGSPSRRPSVSESVLQRFRQRFSLRFQKFTNHNKKPEIESVVVPTTKPIDLQPQPSPQHLVNGVCRDPSFETPSRTSSPLHQRLEALRERGFRPPKKDIYDTKCDSADSGIQIMEGAQELLSNDNNQLGLPRECPFTPTKQPLGKVASVERQMSTPSCIRRRPRRWRGHLRLRRSNSQPSDLDKVVLKFGQLTYGSSDQECSPQNASTTTSSDDLSSDNESYHSLCTPTLPYPHSFPLDGVTYAEALWDHVTLEDNEELAFKAGEVIRVTDCSDRAWWWGSIGQRSGWFPSAFVRLRVNQIDIDSLIEPPRKLIVTNDQVRTNVVKEILTTEQDFVQHLQDVIEGYLKQVRRRPAMFSPERIATIFGNVEQIYSFQSMFLKKLESCVNANQPHSSIIGECFLQFKDQFVIYSQYCNNHPLAVRELQELYAEPKYLQFFEACRLLQDMIDISLDGFLLTPVQKICKYPLQLAELLKYTPPHHPDHLPVTQALSAMREVAQLVNERKRRMECLERLAEWQRTIENWEGPDIIDSSSIMIHAGEVARTSSSWSRDLHLFLCDHLLVMCKKDLLKRNTFVYKGRINLNTGSVFEIEDSKDSTKTGFKVYWAERDKWYYFYTKSHSEREEWLKAFREEQEQVKLDKEQGFIVNKEAKRAAQLAVLNKLKPKKPRAKLSKSNRPDTAIAELLLDLPTGPKTRSGSLPSNLQPNLVVASPRPNKKKGSGWFHFGSSKKPKK